VALAAAGVLLVPGAAFAAEGHAPLRVAVWSVLPFAGLLLAIAVLPLLAGHWWHRNRNRALVAALFAAPVVGYLLYLQFVEHQPGVLGLAAALQEYAQFIILLWSLYTVAGGMLVDLKVRATPWANVALLAVGAVLANVVGTTGASMLLIRPFLRINRARKHKAHLPVFFIFIVSNTGGLLTPLGDPPLFLGFLNGVEFAWTLQLYPQWLLANGALLAAFLVWDVLACRREAATDLAPEARHVGSALRVHGLVNVLFLAGILMAVLLQSEQVAGAVAVAGWAPLLRWPFAEAVMLAMGLLSMLFTPRGLRARNYFSWGAIVEVAVLFAGIFVTMVPALALLETLSRPGDGAAPRLAQPFHYFWCTGLLSSLLDNAPTYVALATLAAGQSHFADLMTAPPGVLAAISCGAVFFGALTYIGNGPNFMVKAIAEEHDYPMPSFFGYLAYSAAVLLPVLVLIALVFFPPTL
jgi:Na+/H+ antiporter NhaD/arsenite permease-like protein